MAKNINRDTVYRMARAKSKQYSIGDGDGLSMLIKPNGSKLWRFIYMFGGKQNRISLGKYPAVTLDEARKRRDGALTLLSQGINPAKRDDPCDSAVTFLALLTEWLESVAHLKKPYTHQKQKSRLMRFTEPVQALAIDHLTSQDFWRILKPLIDQRKLETAHRLHAELVAIFDYAIVHGMLGFNIAQPISRQIPAKSVRHRSAIIDKKMFGRLLRDIWHYHGTTTVQCAFKLSPMLFQRPGEIRQMLWTDIDLKDKEWRPYVSKTDFHHIVPLPTQAIELLAELKAITSYQKWVFPSIRGDGRPMSDNTIRTALRTLGYDAAVITPHGFRTTASTFLNEQGWSPDAIERQLAHAPRDHVRAAYNRAQYLEERRRMMQAWADYLTQLRRM